MGRGIQGVLDAQLGTLTQLIRKHQEFGLFSWDENPGQVHPDIAQHRIDTRDAKPINFPPRRQAPHKRRQTAEETQQMLECGVIEPSRSPWAALVELQYKNREKVFATWRFAILCVEFSLGSCVVVGKRNPATSGVRYLCPRLPLLPNRTMVDHGALPMVDAVFRVAFTRLAVCAHAVDHGVLTMAMVHAVVVLGSLAAVAATLAASMVTRPRSRPLVRRRGHLGRLHGHRAAAAATLAALAHLHGSRGRRRGHLGRLGPPPWFTRPPPRPLGRRGGHLGHLHGHAAPASEGVSEVSESLEFPAGP
ncbi:MAG: hypothetical protein BJ554DRAFT_5399 [Olpidium bornovanus]|uniref:Uncharacterized protein n=1 Tax=Olpidium bornovanus TaxID=278681 RepID=A0A8H8DM61_9FUNG|nr:MAG: hypothetical protein BJ554DRAFT_5399 [Olpidium bornovanus]